MKTNSFLPLLLIVIASCSRQDPLNTTTTLLAETKYNLAYGSDSLQKFDAHLPAGRNTTTTKAIIMIHGGGWNSGSKEDFQLYIDSVKKRLPEYAIFNINYRLYNGNNLFPTQENDVKAAVEFIASKAQEYQFNKNKMVVMGASAGAHLALLQAYKYNNPQVKAVVDYFGPTDLSVMYNNPWHPLIPTALQMITGSTPDRNAAVYLQSSPVNFVSNASAPTLILHGTNDNIVDISQSRLLQQALQKANVPHELALFEGEGHGWWRQPALSHSFSKVEQFLKNHVQ